MLRSSLLTILASAAVVSMGTFAAPVCAAENLGTAHNDMFLSPATMQHIATVSPRFVSYNVEMAAVIGAKFWKPYTPTSIAAYKAQLARVSAGGNANGGEMDRYQKRSPINLYDKRLRKLAVALGPAYLRVSGSWASSTYFYDRDGEPPKSPPKGFKGVLTRTEWKGVIEFAKAVDAKLVTSFAVSMGVRNSQGVWTPVQARKLAAYTKSIGGKIAAAEFFNEPDFASGGDVPKGYDAADYARDFAIFRRFAAKDLPQMKIVGPGSVGEGGALMSLAHGKKAIFPGFVSTLGMLTATPKPAVDVFSYHFYGAVSLRCAAMGPDGQTTRAAALSDPWLARSQAAYDYYVRGMRDRFEPGKPVWITETGGAACGGDPWSGAFLDTFRYLNELGLMARNGVKVVMHDTLASSNYALLDPKTFKPRPNYWAALLWHRLMGTRVLDAGPNLQGLHLYAQCLRGHSGGVTLLAINNSRSKAQFVNLPTSSIRYTLSATKLDSHVVRLNGKVLSLGADNTLPKLRGQHIAAGNARLRPATITFFSIPGARNQACR